MKQVWKYNLYQRPMNFWDYYDLLDDCAGVEAALNLAKKEEMITDDDSFILLNLVCADMYEHFENEKRYHIKKTDQLIKRVGGYTDLGGRKERFINYCLSFMKKVLYPKDYAKFQSWVRNETQNA